MHVPLTCGQEMRDRVIGALETGCRQAEMQKIQNTNIDWHSHEIKITKAHTKASVARRIPFDPEGRLGEILRRRRFVGGPKGFVFGDATGAYVRDFNRRWREPCGTRSAAGSRSSASQIAIEPADLRATMHSAGECPTHTWVPTVPHGCV
jgi:hypothetical protein